jgi:xanthine/CO dehydrogenase XdhC/CoxF family maturation factor
LNNWVLRKAQELLAQGDPFALATVVRRERPTSSEPGDKAIITADGDLMGWVGGSCAQPTVVKEAQGAIADGEPSLVVITPNPTEQGREGAILYHMSCYSGGTLEIHMTVDARIAQTTFEFESVVYYFCSAHCKNSFERNPREYISVEARA